MNCCEEVGLLKSIGAFGNDFFKNSRTAFMLFANILVILSFMLSCVAMAGGSTDKDNTDYVKDGACAGVFKL